MRGSYNDVMTAYHRLTPTGPLVPYRFEIPCRLVFQHFIMPLDVGLVRYAWVTYDPPRLVGPSISQIGVEYTINYTKCDIVVIATMPFQQWIAFQTEQVGYGSKPVYYRTWLFR